MASAEVNTKDMEGEAAVPAVDKVSEEPKDATANITSAAPSVEKEKSEEASTKTESATGNEGYEVASTQGDVDRTWDHTNRKVVVRNMPKFMKNKDIENVTKSWLTSLDTPNSIRITKTKKAPNQPWIQVTLETEDMVQPFVDHINNSKFTNHRGDIMQAVRSDAEMDTRKRKGDDDEEEQGDAKRRKPSGPKTDDEVRDTITPLWRLSYDRQLITKQRDMIRKCATKIVQEVKRKFRNIEKEARRNKNREATPVYDWANGKRPINIPQILPSPKQTEYRNKCEMNFGYRYELDIEGDVNEEDGPAMKKTPAVGFLASGWSGGVSHPHMLANIPSEACAIVDVVNKFLQDSPTIPYDSKAHRGLWRVLTIRISRRTKECMVIIMHAPPSGGIGAQDETDDYSHLFESEKARLISMLTDSELMVPERDYTVVKPEKESGAAKAGDEIEARCEEVVSSQTGASESPSSFRVTSVFFQEYDGVSNPTPEHPVQVSFSRVRAKGNLYHIE